MYDHPTLEQLIDAARAHFEANVIPAVRADRKLYFQTLVAINVLRIAERELEHGADHAAAEWQRLNTLENVDSPLPPRLDALKTALAERNQTLARGIRYGDYDDEDSRAALFEHLQMSVMEQLQVANPRFLGRLLLEKSDPTQDAWADR